MSEILFQYQRVYPTTWAYLSSLLMIGLFFKFNRFWSVRNADLVLLILLAPGLLLVYFGKEMVAEAEGQLRKERQAAAAQPAPGGADQSLPREGQTADGEAEKEAKSDDSPGASPGQVNAAGQDDRPLGADAPPDAPPEDAPPAHTLAADALALSGEALDDLEQTPAEQAVAQARSTRQLGFIWLFGVGLLLLVRLLADVTMARRPLLEPNLTTGGLIFSGCSLFVFLMANVIASKPTEDDLAGPREADQLLSGDGDEEEVSDESSAAAAARREQRHGPGYRVLYLLPNVSTMPLEEGGNERVRYVALAKTMAILSHLAIVAGMVGIGYRHFGNIKMGIGAATMYLILPYTSLMTGRVAHALPAAMLIWAVMLYRRPLAAGGLLGVAASLIYYPLFVLPLWISFYWQRGLMRFLTGLLSALGLMILFPVLGGYPLKELLVEMFGVWWPVMENLEGVWKEGWDPHYRLPIIFAFLALSGTFAIWPAQKNLGTLLSCTAALMVAVQFWHGFGGGEFMAWYLPLLLMTVFRPNLEDRVALSVLSDSWFPRPKGRSGGGTLAA